MSTRSDAATRRAEAEAIAAYIAEMERNKHDSDEQADERTRESDPR